MYMYGIACDMYVAFCSSLYLEQMELMNRDVSLYCTIHKVLYKNEEIYGTTHMQLHTCKCQTHKLNIVTCG